MSMTRLEPGTFWIQLLFDLVAAAAAGFMIHFHQPKDSL